MKTLILIMTIASALFFQNIFDSKILQAQTANKSSSITTLPAVDNPPTMQVQLTAAQTKSSVSNPTAQSLPIISPPSDIASLTAKEILAANNQVVSQMASMYQNFGLFLTIIVTIVGGLGTWLSIAAKKSVQEFIKEWNKKMESLESEMKNSLDRLHCAVSEAELSAKKAAQYEQSFKDNISVLDKSLHEVDSLKTSIVSLHAQTVGEQQDVSLSPTDTGLILPPSQPPAIDEDAEVSARLHGKINPIEGEG